jgi:hypothetical protein
MLKRVGTGRALHVVHPDWIMHSVAKGRLLNEKRFQVLKDQVLDTLTPEIFSNS